MLLFGELIDNFKDFVLLICFVVCKVEFGHFGKEFLLEFFYRANSLCRYSCINRVGFKTFVYEATSSDNSIFTDSNTAQYSALVTYVNVIADCDSTISESILQAWVKALENPVSSFVSDEE